MQLVVESILQELGVAYEPQKVINRAIIDFYLPDLHICLEVDGFYWHGTPERMARDRRRDHWLKSQGYNVVRLTEKSIKENALQATIDALNLK